MKYNIRKLYFDYEKEGRLENIYNKRSSKSTKYYFDDEKEHRIKEIYKRIIVKSRIISFALFLISLSLMLTPLLLLYSHCFVNFYFTLLYFITLSIIIISTSAIFCEIEENHLNHILIFYILHFCASTFSIINGIYGTLVSQGQIIVWTFIWTFIVSIQIILAIFSYVKIRSVPGIDSSFRFRLTICSDCHKLIKNPGQYCEFCGLLLKF